MDDALSWGSILIRVAAQLLPVWIGLIAIFALSFQFKRRLGLYGRIFDSPVGMIGFALVMFWVFTAIFAVESFAKLGAMSPKYFFAVS